MKNFLICFALLLPAISFAQSESQEAENQLKKSSEHIKAKKYSEALSSTAKAYSEIKKLIGLQLATALPTSVGEWKANPSKDKTDLGEIGVTRTYEKQTAKGETEKPKQEDQRDEEAGILSREMPDRNTRGGKPNLMVTVSNNPSIVNMVSSAHQLVGDLNRFNDRGGDVSAIRIKDYRAVLRYQPETKFGEIMMVIGGAGIQIKGVGVEEMDLKKLAESIDPLKVKTVLGE